MKCHFKNKRLKKARKKYVKTKTTPKDKEAILTSQKEIVLLVFLHLHQVQGILRKNSKINIKGHFRLIKLRKK
jgi:hypothetical protein